MVAIYLRTALLVKLAFRSKATAEYRVRFSAVFVRSMLIGYLASHSIMECYNIRCASVAQGTEHRSPKAGVVRSNRAGGTIECCRSLAVFAGGLFWFRVEKYAQDTMIRPCAILRSMACVTSSLPE